MSKADYILRKDLPDTDAGTKLFLQDGRYYYKSRTEEDRWFPRILVEGNANWFQKVSDDRDWEIIELRHDSNTQGVFDKGLIERFLCNKDWFIYCVKRLSDGEVFMVGDQVVHKDGSYVSKIIGFCNEHINWFYFESGRYYVKDLNNFRLIQPWQFIHLFKFDTALQKCDCTGEEHDQKCPYRPVESSLNKKLKEMWDDIQEHLKYKPAPYKVPEEFRNLWRDFKNQSPKEQPKRIEITGITSRPKYKDPRITDREYVFETAEGVIPFSKFDSIKKAIEEVLNDEFDIDERIKKGSLWVEQFAKLTKTYTQADIDKAREDAFNAARELVPNINYNYNTFSPVNKFRRYTDYINHLKSKQP